MVGKQWPVWQCITLSCLLFFPASHPFSSLTAWASHFPNKAWALQSCLRLFYQDQRHHSRALSTLARAEALIFHWMCKESYLGTNINRLSIPSVIQGYFRSVVLKATQSVASALPGKFLEMQILRRWAPEIYFLKPCSWFWKSLRIIALELLIDQCLWQLLD